MPALPSPGIVARQTLGLSFEVRPDVSPTRLPRKRANSVQASWDTLIHRAARLALLRCQHITEDDVSVKKNGQQHDVSPRRLLYQNRLRRAALTHTVQRSPGRRSHQSEGSSLRSVHRYLPVELHEQVSACMRACMRVSRKEVPVDDIQHATSDMQRAAHATGGRQHAACGVRRAACDTRMRSVPPRMR